MADGNQKPSRRAGLGKSVGFIRAAADKENPWPVRLACAFATLYLLSPIDLIPDPIPIFGYMDDALVILTTVVWVVNRRKNKPV